MKWGREEGSIPYYSELGDTEWSPLFLHESVRDIDHWESLAIGHHEFILYYFMKLPVTHDNINMTMSNTDTDAITWIPFEEIKPILNRKKKNNLLNWNLIKHK